MYSYEVLGSQVYAESLYMTGWKTTNRTDTDGVTHGFLSIATKDLKKSKKYCGQTTTENDKKAKHR